MERKEKKKIILGTAAFLDVKWKGHIYVIKALAELKKQGIENIEYQMIGSGTGKKIVKLANKLGVSEQVVILGAKKHEEVFNWLDEIDIYIHIKVELVKINHNYLDIKKKMIMDLLELELGI